MRRLFAFASPLIVLVACGDPAPPKTPVTDATAKKPDGGSTDGPAVAGRKGPSKELAARWPLGPNPDVVGYVDVGAFASTEIVKGMAPVLLGMPEVPEPVRTCAKATLANAKELLVGRSKSEPFAVVRVEGTAVQDACAPLLGSSAAKIKGAVTASLGGSDIVAFAPGWVYVGSKETVAKALDAKFEAAPDIGLAPGEVAATRGTEGGVDFDGTMAMTDKHFQLAGNLTCSDEDNAKYLETLLARGKTESKGIGKSVGGTAEMSAMLDHVLESWSYSREGKKVHLVFDLVEGPADQARDLGMMATLAVYGVRKYISNAKQAEARNVLGQLAKDYVSYWESEELDPKTSKVLDRKTKKLITVGPVPKTVPKGIKYQSSHADWRPWEKLRFEMTLPQYFQYEIKLSKDAKGVDIVAHGDLNGDGKTSEFVLHIEKKGERLLVSPSIAEKDPDE